MMGVYYARQRKKQNGSCPFNQASFLIHPSLLDHPSFTIGSSISPITSTAKQTHPMPQRHATLKDAYSVWNNIEQVKAVREVLGDESGDFSR
jgi:hypothetical protein